MAKVWWYCPVLGDPIRHNFPHQVASCRSGFIECDARNHTPLVPQSAVDECCPCRQMGYRTCEGPLMPCRCAPKQNVYSDFDCKWPGHKLSEEG
jgi:hypothetical protein